MKKAVRISAIVYIPLLIIAILGFITACFVCFAVAANAEAVAKESTDPQMTADAIRASFSATGTVCLITAIMFVPGLVFDIVLLKKASNPNNVDSKGTWIAFGVLSILFGASVTGILSIITGATLKQDTNEVNFQPK